MRGGFLNRTPPRRTVSAPLTQRVQIALDATDLRKRNLEVCAVMTNRAVLKLEDKELLLEGRCPRCGNARYSAVSKMYRAQYFFTRLVGERRAVAYGLIHYGCVPEVRYAKNQEA